MTGTLPNMTDDQGTAIGNDLEGDFFLLKNKEIYSSNIQQNR